MTRAGLEETLVHVHSLWISVLRALSFGCRLPPFFRNFSNSNLSPEIKLSICAYSSLQFAASGSNDDRSLENIVLGTAEGVSRAYPGRVSLSCSVFATCNKYNLEERLNASFNVDVRFLNLLLFCVRRQRIRMGTVLISILENNHGEYLERTSSCIFLSNPTCMSIYYRAISS